MDQKIKTYEEYCDHGSNSAGCQQGAQDAHHWEHVAHAIHICSIIVLSIFMVEVCFKIYFTWDHFIKHKIEVADAIIVIISFILDLVFLNDDVVGGLVGESVLLVLKLRTFA